MLMLMLIVIMIAVPLAQGRRVHYYVRIDVST